VTGALTVGRVSPSSGITRRSYAARATPAAITASKARVGPEIASPAMTASVAPIAPSVETIGPTTPTLPRWSAV
jgi:hypothetical protein